LAAVRAWRWRWNARKQEFNGRRRIHDIRWLLATKNPVQLRLHRVFFCLFEMFVECFDAIASRLTPTRDL
jgi:hypothetical protein